MGEKADRLYEIREEMMELFEEANNIINNANLPQSNLASVDVCMNHLHNLIVKDTHRVNHDYREHSFNEIIQMVEDEEDCYEDDEE